MMRLSCGGGEAGSTGFGVGVHRSELDDDERRAVLADARLVVEHRAAGPDPDVQRQQRQDGNGQRQRQHEQGEVEQALEPRLVRREAVHQQGHERHAGDLSHRLQPEQRVAGADALEEADSARLERGHRLGECRVEAERVEQQDVGALSLLEHGGQLVGIGDVADDLDLAFGRLDVAGGELGVDVRTDEHHPRRSLATTGEDAAEVAIEDEHDGADEEEDAEVEAGHQVAIEEDERHQLDADADRHRHHRPWQPRSPAEARLAFVEAVEVVDDEVDRRRDGKAGEVERPRVRRPVDAEADEADHHHRSEQADGVEEEQESEAVAPHPAQRAVQPADHPFGSGEQRSRVRFRRRRFRVCGDVAGDRARRRLRANLARGGGRANSGDTSRHRRCSVVVAVRPDPAAALV